MPRMELRPYQSEAVRAIEDRWAAGDRATLLVMATGCHAVGEKVLMYDGSQASVEDVKAGDLLMGSDGLPRTVLKLHRGEDELYRVKPVKGEPFTVNGGHVLSLMKTNRSTDPCAVPSHRRGGEIVDVTLSEWIGWPKSRKHVHKLYRSSAIKRFGENDGDAVTVDPYFLGVLLGDGNIKYSSISVTTMDVEVADEVFRQAGLYGATVRTERAGKATTYIMRSGATARAGGKLVNQLKQLGLHGTGSGDKFVPHCYKTLPIEQRLEVIAGLIDTDGSLSSACGYDFISKSERLASDLAFMCRSVGLAAYVKSSIKKCQGGFAGEYWRVSISGDCSVIPCRVRHKVSATRNQKKDVLRTGFSIEPVGVGRYAGFTVDGDNRYLMGDFTVTHNCGKTVVMAKVAEDAVRMGGRVLVLAHRGELLQQAADKIRAATGLRCSVEKAEETSVGTFERVTVGSVQTLMREKRLRALGSGRFSHILVDEAHHAVSDSYRMVLDYFDGARILGVTATADRGDKRSLGEVFDSLAYEYDLVRAIKEGYLCPIEAQTVPLKVDISGVSVRNGDWAAEELGTALDPYLPAIADEMASTGLRGGHVVAFLPLIKTSQKFCEILRDRGFRAAEVNGQSEDRAEKLAAFARGEYDVLCNSLLLTEGWDCPPVDCIVNLRPTRSRSLYAQIVGRGTRLSPETGKTHLLLLDFLWMTERMDLVRPAHLVAGSEEVARRMTERLEESGAAVDLEELEKKASEDVVAQREESLARELAAQRHKKARLVDPLQFEMSIADEDLSGYVPSFGWEMAPASDKQMAALEKYGINPESIGCAGKASLMLERLQKRRSQGLSTPKQIRLLEGRGFRRVGSWTLDDASKVISRIASNGWRTPAGMDPATYEPGEVA